MSVTATKKSYSKPTAEMVESDKGIGREFEWTKHFPEMFGCDVGCETCSVSREEATSNCHHAVIWGNEDRYDR